MSETNYELIVIGSGPAGEKAASAAAALGHRAALIEKDSYFGGASTNTGTLPSKTFRETALVLSGMKTRGLYGVDLALKHKVTVRDFMFHEDHVKTQERARVGGVLGKWKVDTHQGSAAFVDPHTVRVTSAAGEKILTAERFLLATGSSPLRPALFPFESPIVHDSDEVLTMECLPESLAVVGAGVIGSEYACTFAALGVETHLIDGRDTLMPFLDREITDALTQGFETLGIKFHRPRRVTGCKVEDRVTLTFDSGENLLVDQVLVAAGRCSNVAGLNLAAAGITPGERGLIKVDDLYRTSVPHIYAAGDIIGFPALAATSAEQGRLAVYHAFGYTSKLKLASILPTGIYTIPEVSMAGETEETIKAKGVPYVVGRADYAATVRGQIIGDGQGFLKLIFSNDADMKLLGCHVIGESASEVLHIGLMAMLTGNGRELLGDACFNYPTLGELYKIATFDAEIRRGF